MEVIVKRLKVKQPNLLLRGYYQVKFLTGPPCRWVSERPIQMNDGVIVRI